LIIVFKASLRRRLGAKAQLEVKVSRHLEIRRKVTVAVEKNLKRGVAAAGRRKSGDGGSESGFRDLRFGPESHSSPLIRGGGSRSGDGWDRRRGGGGSRGRGGGGESRGRGGGDGVGAGGEGIRTADERPRWRLPLSVPDGLKWRLLGCFFVSEGRIRARWSMGQQIWASWTGRIQPMSYFFRFFFSFLPF
jgi:hypothetical protein